MNIKRGLSFFISILLFFCIDSFAQGNNPQGTVRFVHITDVHLNPQRDNVKGRMVKHSLELLNDAVEQINGMKDIDFVIFTGDMADRSDQKLLVQFTEAANELEVPWYWTTGNHDLAPSGMKSEQLLSVMNAHNPYIQPKSTCYSFSVKGFLFFSMDGASDEKTTSQGWFSDECLMFLDERLSASPNTPAVVFQHFPLVYPYQSSSHSVTNGKEYLDLIARHPNVKALFAGHFHAARIKKTNNVLHVASPALVEYPNAFRVVAIQKTGNNYVFDIRTVETRLKDVQGLSKSKSPAALNFGKEDDRNLRVTIK